MNHFPILLADADWLGLLIAVVMGIVWVLNQVFGKAQAPPPRRPNQPPVRPQPNANVQQELESFLRRAAQQRAGQAQGQPGQMPTSPFAQPATQPPRTLVAPRSEALSQPLRRPAAEDIDEGEGPHGPSVGEHVKQHFETRSFTERTPHLTKVDTADEQMEQHLHQTFDRQLGRLGATVESATAGISSTDQPATASHPAVSASVGIAALLRDPRSARNAIILQEVLARPESRWGS